MDSLVQFKVFFFEKGDRCCYADIEGCMMAGKKSIDDVTDVLPHPTTDDESSKDFIVFDDYDSVFMEDCILFEFNGMLGEGWTENIKSPYDAMSGVEYDFDYSGSDIFENSLDFLEEEVMKFRNEKIKPAPKKSKIGDWDFDFAAKLKDPEKVPRVMNIVTVWSYHSSHDSWTGEWDCWSECLGILDLNNLKVRELDV